MLSPAVKHESSKTWISPWFTTGSLHRGCSPLPRFVYCSYMTDCVYLLQVCDLALPAAVSWTITAVQPSPGRLWSCTAAPKAGHGSRAAYMLHKAMASVSAGTVLETPVCLSLALKRLSDFQSISRNECIITKCSLYSTKGADFFNVILKSLQLKTY